MTIALKSNFKQKKTNAIISPTEYASKLGREYSLESDSKTKRQKGQYFTHESVARHMSKFISIDQGKTKISILDPGAGLGILSCASIERILIQYPNVTEIRLELYELDQLIISGLKKVVKHLNKWVRERGVNLDSRIFESDFILDNSVCLNDEPTRKFDLIITNPPYFKLQKSDCRAVAAEPIVHGQPNIYFIFLAISSCLLTHDGSLISITPRSFTAGKYFKKFREFFFGKIRLSHIHVFESRNKAFEKDNVLQETIILNCRKRSICENSNVTLTFSEDISDLDSSKVFICNESEIIDLNSVNKVLFLPTSIEDINLRRKFDRWNQSLSDLGLKASTGPVVFFRNAEALCAKENKTSVPLIWLNNIYPMALTWPNHKSEKQQFILNTKQSKSALLENKNYVLIRRFSAKGDKMRVIACPHIANNLSKYKMIGLENKLNYITKIVGELSEAETVGLSALLSSSYYNQYFTLFNGNTNVSVTDLNQITFPPLKKIATIGEKLIKTGFTEKNIEDLTNPLFK